MTIPQHKQMGTVYHWPPSRRFGFTRGIQTPFSRGVFGCTSDVGKICSKENPKSQLLPSDLLITQMEVTNNPWKGHLNPPKRSLGRTWSMLFSTLFSLLPQPVKNPKPKTQKFPHRGHGARSSSRRSGPPQEADKISLTWQFFVTFLGWLSGPWNG